MGLFDRVLRDLSARIVDSIMDRTEINPVLEARAYRQGYYRPQLKVRVGQFDDNLGLNYVGLIEDRVISQMLGQGFTLDFEGDTETAQEQYISAFLDANQQEILFKRAAQAAGEAGTGYLLILPDGVVGKDGQVYPRLQLLDPTLVTMQTLPEDYEIVVRYIYQYKFTDADGKDKARRITYQHNAPDENGQGGDAWTVITEINQGGSWEVISTESWPFNFAPILHWQNMPSAFDIYGQPDITDSLRELQDRVNFIASNISKLIRYYAHPMRIAKNVGTMEKVDVGADQMVKINGTDADITQLDPLGDLASSLAFFDKLEKAMFNTARVVDLSSYEDKIGALTNFGLKVLYQDDSAMIATKRELFGDMLEELVRRVLILTGQQEIPCEVVWPDFLPVNPQEELAALETQLRMGIVSKETIATEIGRDWEAEQERMDSELQAQDNIGNALLRAFNQGGGGSPGF